MYKEIGLCLFIVIAIFLLDFWTLKITKNSVDEVTQILEELKIELNKKDENKVNEKMEQVNNRWEEVYKKLAYFIEHNELESVETNLKALKGFIEVGDYDTSINELEKGEFVLEHIAQKYRFCLINVF